MRTRISLRALVGHFPGSVREEYLAALDEDTTSRADLLAVLKELMAWHDCLPTRNVCDIEDDARRVIAAAEVRS